MENEYHFEIGELIHINYDNEEDVGICIERKGNCYRFLWQRKPTSYFYQQRDIVRWFGHNKWGYRNPNNWVVRYGK